MIMDREKQAQYSRDPCSRFEAGGIFLLEDVSLPTLIVVPSESRRLGMSVGCHRILSGEVVPTATEAASSLVYVVNDPKAARS